MAMQSGVNETLWASCGGSTEKIIVETGYIRFTQIKDVKKGSLETKSANVINLSI